MFGAIVVTFLSTRAKQFGGGAPAEVVYDATGRAGPDELHEVADQLYAMRHATTPFAGQAMQQYADCLNMK